MKKAVVLEIREEYAAVLTDEGFVKKIPDRRYAVGEEIELTDAPGRRENHSAVPRRRLAGWYRAAAAAAVILAVSGGGLYYASENAFAYSTVTVTTDGTSMELILNKKDEVVAVKTFDENSEKTVSELHISVARRRPLSETIERITEGRKQTSVTVTSGNEEHRQKLEEKVTEMLPQAQPEKTVPEPAAAPEKAGDIPDPAATPEKAGNIPEPEDSSGRGNTPKPETVSGENNYRKETVPSEQGMPPEQNMTPEQGMPPGQGMMQPQGAGPYGGMGPAS